MQRTFTWIGLFIAALFLSSNIYAQQPTCEQPAGCDLKLTDWIFPDGDQCQSGCPHIDLEFEAPGADYVSFSLMSINQSLNGKPSTRWIDSVTVTTASGQTHVYTGADGNPEDFTVNLCNVGTWVRVAGENAYDSEATGDGIQVSLVSYCGFLPGECAVDADDDGICDCTATVTTDCDNFIDADNDGIEDSVDDCVSVSYFIPNLAVEHNSTSSFTLPLDGSATDIAFRLSGPFSRGNSKNIATRIRVTSDDGTDLQFIGTDRRDITIAGPSTWVTIDLDDTYGGNKQLKFVSFGEVTSCKSSGTNGAITVQQSFEVLAQRKEVRTQLAPNPTSGITNLTFEQPTTADIQVYDVMGRQLINKQVEHATQVELDVAGLTDQQIVFVSVLREGLQPETYKLLLVK